MTLLAIVTLLVAILGLAATALLSLVRIVRGPTILDRMIAADVLLTTILLAAGTDMVLRNETYAIPLMVVIAATSVLATIVVARFVRRREQDEALTAPSRGSNSRGGSHD